MGSTPHFTTQIDARNGVARLALAGELDTRSAPAFLDQLTTIAGDGVGSVVLDLRDVTFVDSTGLHAFLTAHERAKTNGHNLVLIGVRPSTRRLFEITGTQFLLDDRLAAAILGEFLDKGRPVGSLEFAVTAGENDD